MSAGDGAASMTRRAAVLVLALAGALLLPLLPVVAGPVAPAAATAAADLEITLTEISPSAVTPRTPLVVAGTVRNAGGTAAAPGRVSLDLRTGVLGSRDEVTAWVAEGRGSGSTRELPGAVPVPQLAPGATAAFRITVPARGLQLGTREADFGPRGLIVRATEGGTEVERIRTTTVWFPVKRFSPTRLSLLVPITAGQNTDAAAASASALGRDGRLGRLVDAARDPAVSWALDPALLAAAQRLRDGGAEEAGDDPGATPTGTPSPEASAGGLTPEQRVTGAEWLAKVLAESGSRDVLGLPFADTDVTSVTRAGGRDLLGTADALGRKAAEDAGVKLDTTAAWPAEGATDQATVGVLGAAGRQAVVLGSATVPTTEELGYTPTGRGDVRYDGGTLDGLLYDEGLSALFAAAGGPRGVVAGQELAAQLAAITLERPGDPRHVLAVAPRGWDPDPAGVQRALAGLRSAPWVALRSLTELRGTPPGEEARGAAAYPAAVQRAELPAQHVRTMGQIRGQILGYGRALTDPEPVVDPLLERDVSLLSAAWRRNRTGLGAARAPLAREANDLARGVHIVRGSQRPYLLASEADLPVYVANGTPYPVRVSVQLRPRSGRMRVEGAVPVDLAPNTQRQQVLVPVEALSSGDVQITASLLTSGGELPGTERQLTVRVRREWETRGLIGAGGVLGVLLLVGLARGFRRGRDRVRPEDVPDVDDLATAGGDRASARMDALDPLATGEMPVLRPGLLTPDGDPGTRPDVLPDTKPRTNDDASSQNGPGDRPVASSGHADDDEGDAAGNPAGESHDARDRPVMSKEQQ